MADRAQTDHIWDTSAQIDSAGSANAYVIDTAEAITGYARGMPPIRFKANFANTGAATANINGLGAVALKKFGGATDLASGDIISGGVYTLAYDGTNLQVLELNTGVTATANLADDAVTYAKLQDVSATARILGRKTSGAGDVEECTLSEVLDFIGSAAQGDILYRGASAWARLGAGTDGQFLETSGPGANPQWSTLSAWQKISAVTANNSATIDFTGLDTSAFAAFAITISNMVPATDGTSFSIRTDEDNGSSFDSGASDYQYAFTSSLSDGTSDPEGDAAHTQMVCTATLGNAGEENAGGIIFLFLGGARAAFITWDLAVLNPSTLLRNAKGAGCRNGIGTGVDAVRLFMTSGNITSGIFTLYGMPA